jgi:hypothetical protein
MPELLIPWSVRRRVVGFDLASRVRKRRAPDKEKVPGAVEIPS